MAKGIYIGVSGVTRKVKKMNIGVNGVARKVKKGYIGVNGVARQFYASEQLAPFTSNPAPTSWSPTGGFSSSIALEFQGSNQYGIWTINADSKYTTDNTGTVNNAFDGDADTAWISDKRDSNDSEGYIGISLPTGVTIKPSTILAKYSCIKSGCIKGFNPLTESWEALAELGANTSYIEEPYTITTNNYYSIFKIVGTRYSSQKPRHYVCNFQITSGTLKIE